MNNTCRHRIGLHLERLGSRGGGPTETKRIMENNSVLLQTLPSSTTDCSCRIESGTFIRDSGKWHGAIDLVNAHQIGGQKQFAFIWDE